MGPGAWRTDVLVSVGATATRTELPLWRPRLLTFQLRFASGIERELRSKSCAFSFPSYAVDRTQAQKWGFVSI